MNFDKIKGSKDGKNFNQNFDSQMNEFNAKNNKKPTHFNISQQKRGFAEDEFDLLEPSQKDTPGNQSRNVVEMRDSDFTLNSTRAGQINRTNSHLEQTISDLMVNMRDEDEFKKSEKIIHKSSESEDSMSMKLSARAVLDNQNTHHAGISHQKVRGFRLKEKQEGEESRVDFKLTDDILFQGLSFEELSKAYQAAQQFSSSFNIVKYLIDDSLKYMDDLKIEDPVQIKRYLHSKGFFNFEKYQEKMAGFTKSFHDEKTEKAQGGSVDIKSTDRFQVNEEFDFKEWEHYFILSSKDDSTMIDHITIPQQIRTILELKDGNDVPINKILSLKGGCKYGKKISNPDIKWTEEWFEVVCQDAELSEIWTGIEVNKDNNKKQQVMIKYFSKLYTKIEDSSVEGESLMQILNKHQVLQYEMKDTVKVDNILNKEGSLKNRTIQVKKLVPVGLKKAVPVFESARENGASNSQGQVEEDITNPEFDLFHNTNVLPVSRPSQELVLPVIMEESEEDKRERTYEAVMVDHIIQDKYVNNLTPLEDREIRIECVRRFVTQFNGTDQSGKVREEGVEHYWLTPTSSKYKTGNWTSIFQGKVESVKELRFTETDRYATLDPHLEHISREGTNEHGEFWTEEVQINKPKNFIKWEKSSTQPAHLREDGFEKKWGEYREEKLGETTKGEKWEEMVKPQDDYWQRSSEKYEECAAKKLETEEQEGPVLMRSGITEFRNNRNYLNAEHWEEFYDGSLLKKIVNDNGYGQKSMTQIGQRLDIDKLFNIKKETDENGFFKAFVDESDGKFESLKVLIENTEGTFLCWEYTNQTLEDLCAGKVSYSKKGKDYVNGDEWSNLKNFDYNADEEYVANYAKDAGGDWQETWKKVKLERWCQKTGKRGAHQWNEKWYKKIKALSKKKDELG